MSAPWGAPARGQLRAGSLIGDAFTNVEQPLVHGKVAPNLFANFLGQRAQIGQTRTVRSELAEARRSPSGEKATDLTAP